MTRVSRIKLSGVNAIGSINYVKSFVLPVAASDMDQRVTATFYTMGLLSNSINFFSAH